MKIFYTQISDAGDAVEASMLITLARFGLYKKKKSNVDLAGWEAFLLDARDTGWK